MIVWEWNVGEEWKRLTSLLAQAGRQVVEVVSAMPGLISGEGEAPSDVLTSIAYFIVLFCAIKGRKEKMNKASSSGIQC